VETGHCLHGSSMHTSYKWCLVFSMAAHNVLPAAVQLHSTCTNVGNVLVPWSSGVTYSAGFFVCAASIADTQHKVHTARPSWSVHSKIQRAINSGEPCLHVSLTSLSHKGHPESINTSSLALAGASVSLCAWPSGCPAVRRTTPRVVVRASQCWLPYRCIEAPGRLLAEASAEQ
jgi:hypothetical protein